MNPLNDYEVPMIGRDPDLLEVFYRQHIGEVKAFFARRVTDPHQVADLTAETFLAAIDSAEKYNPDKGRPIGWLMGIARNTMADSQRSAARRNRAERRIEGRRLLDEDATARIDERIQAERLTQELYAGLARLPERDRALLERVAVDGMTVADAAAELGIKAGTARVRLHRSKARLQQYLDTLSARHNVDQVLPSTFPQEA